MTEHTSPMRPVLTARAHQASSRLLGIFIANGFASEARVAATLFREHADQYEPIALYNSWEGESESAARFEAASGVRVVRFDFGWRPNPLGERSRAAKLASWSRLHLSFPSLFAHARRLRPHAVYSSQQIWDCYAASWIAGVLRVPHIVHLHYTIGPYLGAHTLWRLKHCAQVVAISDFIRGEALRHGVREGDVAMIHNAVDIPAPPVAERLEPLRRELRLEPKAQIATIIARVDPSKGHADTVAAFAAIAGRLPAARLLVAGTGTSIAKVEADISARGLRERVLLLGYREDVDDLRALSDVFVHPSRDEPFGLAILEAAAAGKPVVAYAEGGIPEIVVDGQTGLLVPPGDRGALADALLRLLTDRAAARRMGEAGRARAAATFRPQVAGARFAEVLAGVAVSRRPSDAGRDPPASIDRP